MGALKPGYQITPDLLLQRRLGAGGMGTVWIAHHAKLGTEVVIKFLSEALAADADACERFSREVTATVQVRSPHVVQMLDHGITDGGLPYIVMELLEGNDLSKTMREQGPLRADEVQHVIDGVAAALTKAHERGVVHRDIKPANVFMCTASPRPFVKLVDFGIAKRLTDESMTATHALLGTPAYMSPEQMSGRGDVDHRSDLWAVGVLAYHTLTGKPPFRGAHIANIAHAIFNEGTPRVTDVRPDLPAEVDQWMERALARDPSQRFNTAQEMADALAVAFGDLAYLTTRRLHGTANGPASTPAFAVHGAVPPAVQTGRSGVISADQGRIVVQPAPSGAILQQVAPSLSGSYEGDGSTFGPSALTHSPYGNPARMKWWVMGIAALGVVAAFAAFQIGAGVRRSPRFSALGSNTASSTAYASVLPPPAASTLPHVERPTGTVIGASPEPPPPVQTSSVPSAAPVPPPRYVPPPPRRPPGRVPGKKGSSSGDDDVGF